ncbi:MAG: hypothetical protein P1U68_16555 [Verrucomicrobiales bacterium]|nr:hypothetical protein [Verrucomicrobiales bacterium]
MKALKVIALVSVSVASLSLVSCETMDSGPKPERERLSSIPHNMPESWEGQGGMPGQMGGY